MGSPTSISRSVGAAAIRSSSSARLARPPVLPVPDVPPPVFWVSFLTNVPFIAVQLCSGMGNAQRGVTTCTSKNVAATCNDGSNDHSKDVSSANTDIAGQGSTLHRNCCIRLASHSSLRSFEQSVA